MNFHYIDDDDDDDDDVDNQITFFSLTFPQ